MSGIQLNEQPLVAEGDKAGEYLDGLKRLNVGSGSKTMKSDDEYFYLGAENSADAPFKVSFEGILTALGMIIKTAATGSRMEFNANEVVFYDAAGNARFVVVVNDASTFGDAGDVIIGNYAGNKGIFWDNSAGTFTIRGSLNANDVTAGILAGRTVKAVGGAGVDVWMNSADGTLEFRYGNAVKAYIAATSSGALFIDSDTTILLEANENVFITYADSGAGGCGWYEGDTGIAMSLDTAKDLIVANDIYADNYFDYAEFFESTDEYLDGIPVGTTVSLEGDKVRPALPGEVPIGSVSGSAAIILNGGSSDAGQSWGKKYLTDEFGRKIFEKRERWYLRKGKKTIKGWSDETPAPKDATTRIRDVQVVNPEWDKTKKFIPRKERPEWNKIGLLGRVRLLKGQPVSTHWIKLKDISDTVEEWLIR